MAIPNDVKPRIRLVHLLLSDDRTPERQQKSIESIQRLAENGIEYIQVWNKRWQDTPPRDTFSRPNEYDIIPINPGHYGNFRAFADSAQEYFTEDLDGFIFCEGDAFLVKDIDQTVDAINRAYQAMIDRDIAYFSFGSRYHLETGELQSTTRQIYDDIHIVDKMIGAQMVMFTHKMRRYLIDRFIYHVWDAADIFLNNIFCNKFDMAIFEDAYAVQVDGVSAIDGNYKEHTGEHVALNKNRDMQKENKKRIVYLAPHLSTGGMPQFVLSRLRALQDQNEYEVHLVEYNQYSHAYVVQRNQIVEMLGDKFHSIGYLDALDEKQRGDALAQILTEIEPAIIHIDECPEAFDGFNKVSYGLLDWLYSPDRPWRIVETCHNIWFDAKANKKWHPDAYAFCSPHHPDNQFKGNPGFKSVIEHPIINNKPTTVQKAAAKAQLEMDPDKVHILNVGLWTPGKNQAEGVNIAKILNKLFPDKYQFHFVGNQAVNFQEYWGPIMEDVPANVKVWGERHDTEIFYQAADAFMFNSTWECNPLAVREAIGYGLITFSRNLPQYLDMFTPYIIPLSDSLEENADIILTYLQSQEILQGDFAIPHNDMARFGQEHLNFYKYVLEMERQPQPVHAAEFRLEFRKGLFLHCDHIPAGEWHAEFWHAGQLYYRTDLLQEGHWYTPTPKWWAEWQVKIYHDGQLQQTLENSLEGRDVLVNFESSSLGDTLAWMGQMQSFKEQKGIKRLWVRTYKNWLFDREWYQQHNIELFDSPNKKDVDVEINIGVYYSMEQPWQKDRHPNDWRQQPLAKIAADQLDIDYLEIRPKMAPRFLEADLGLGKHVVIATQSTAQAKYWNNPRGWQELTQWHLDQDIRVLHASKEGLPPEGSEQLPEALEDVARAINSAEYFIGISSGLSWFAWALRAKVVMISGFTPEWTEFEEDCLRIIKKDKCWGCWSFHTFDRGDWQWCPSHKGTARQFECTKLIEATDVAAQIIEKEWL